MKLVSQLIEIKDIDLIRKYVPNQTRFLGHGVGLELDESPVIANGFDRSLTVGGTIAIEPKVVYQEGSIGTEDTWLMTDSGMEPITAGAAFPWIYEWE